MRAVRVFGLGLLVSASLIAPRLCGQEAVERLPVSLEPSPETAATLAARAPTSTQDLRLIQDQLQRVLARVVPATTSVEVDRASGSGVIVNAEGLVLTAAHVIGRPGRRAWVELPDGRRFRARTLGADHDADAGMLRIDSPPADLPFAPISEGPPLAPGEWVITTGQPGGLVVGRAPPVRLGRVLFRDDELLCTDCKLVGGDSGGPLFNMQGEVVGIHSSIGPMITHNFHVPITEFRRDWDRLLASELWGGDYDEMDRNRPVLGVSGRTVDDRCVLTQVAEDMPAAKAGVRVDDVILAIDGREISSFEELADIISFKRPGDRVDLLIERRGTEMRIQARLSRPDGSMPRARRPDEDDGRPQSDEN
jgi:serine protease Do